MNEKNVTLLYVGAVLLRGWRWILGSIVVGFLVFVGVGFVLTPSYTAKVSLLPQPESLPSQGILGQLATFTNMSMGEQGTYEELYREILHSDRILDPLLDEVWQFDGHSEVSLLDLWGSGGASGERFKARLKKRLRRQVIFFKKDKKNGYMELMVTIPEHPNLASQVANYLVDALDKFTSRIQNQKAMEKRAFVEERFHKVQSELETAETNLAEFVKQNRGYAQNPVQLQEFGSLEREVQATSSLWVELRRQLEMARIEENKETVSIEILDLATPPVRPSSPNRPLLAFIGIVLGVLVGSTIVLTRQTK